MIDVYWIRPTLRSAVPYEEWTDDALCRDMDHQLFELEDQDETPSEQEWERIAEGLKVCTACPVRQACLNNSTKDDRLWSTRGGQPPEGLFYIKNEGSGEKHSERNSGGKFTGGGELCSEGHNSWQATNKGGGKAGRYCKDCRNAARRKRRAEQAARLAS